MPRWKPKQPGLAFGGRGTPIPPVTPGQEDPLWQASLAMLAVHEGMDEPEGPAGRVLRAAVTMMQMLRGRPARPYVLSFALMALRDPAVRRLPGVRQAAELLLAAGSWQPRASAAAAPAPELEPAVGPAPGAGPD
jgi:hypothetical protein